MFRWERQLPIRSGRLTAASIVALVAVAATLLLDAASAAAARFTPAAWRSEVTRNHDQSLLGQLKNTTWNRDANHDFIDDLMPRRSSVNIILELNECASTQYIQDQFSSYGRITYVGKLVSCAYMSGVPYDSLAVIAHRPDVAMVEWQAPVRPAMGVAIRTDRAGPSGTFPGEWARQYVSPNWAGKTGAGVDIAIIDTGIKNGLTAVPVVGAYDATNDPDGDGKTGDPDVTEPALEHGTRVASIAAGRRPSAVDCGLEGEDTILPDCAGVAPEAGLVDVKVWARTDSPDTSAIDTSTDPIMKGIDWVGIHHADSMNIRVANISLVDSAPCSGECALCWAVNYLASVGVVPVVCLGNYKSGTRDLVASPAAASYAITVAGINDNNTVSRSDDSNYSDWLEGPRPPRSDGYSGPLSEKPDISAPAENIKSLDWEDHYNDKSGTSFAAPQVAGAAAVLIQANPLLDAWSMKDLLRNNADDSKNPVMGSWDKQLGRGILNVHKALTVARLANPRFTNCSGPAGTAGEPCPLADGSGSWDNHKDIAVDPDPPRKGVPTTIKAEIENAGSGPTTDFFVSFGYYVSGTGTAPFHEIQTVPVSSLAPGAKTEVICNWTPEVDGHQCIRAQIEYGADSEYGDNTTQLNVDVEASTYHIQVVNPYVGHALFYVQLRPKWTEEKRTLAVDKTSFELFGSECPADVKVSLRLPIGAKVGEHAICDVAIFGKPDGARDSTLVGGVTVKSIVPESCRFSGVVVDRKGRPVRYARLKFLREDLRQDHADWEKEAEATTDSLGKFTTYLAPEAFWKLAVRGGKAGNDTIRIGLACADSPIRIQVTKHGARIVRKQ